MALWARVQMLGDTMRQMQNIYGSNFPIEVRHFFAQWIESQPWADFDEDNPENEKFAIQFSEQLIKMMEEKAQELSNDEMFLTKLKLQESAVQFKNMYSSNPMSLVRTVKNCLAIETKLVEQADSAASNGKQVSAHRQICERFEYIQRFTQETEAELRQIQHKQEQFIIQYQESLKIANQIQQLASLPNGQTRHDSEQRLQKQKQSIDQTLSQNAQQLLQMRMQLADKHHETCQRLSELQAHFLDDQLISWKRQQQLAGNGTPFDGSLDTLQQWCESLAELIWQNRQQIKKAISFFFFVELLRAQLPINLPPGRQDCLPVLNSTITGLLSSLVTSTFIIEKQPPQVLKKDSRFTATVRLLVGGKLNVHMNPPTVKATIISEEQARILLKNDKNIRNETSGDILNNMGSMEYHQANGQLSITFRNMALKRIRRAEKKGNETVTEEKFSILFQSQFSVGGGELVFQVWTLSLPVVVTVHGNQECNALATILWDNAFAEPGRLPFLVPEKVPWPSLAQTLMTKFASHCGLGLSVDNLNYLAFKSSSSSSSSSPSFFQEPLTGRNFTFWEWFYSILKLTKDWLQGPWKDRLITGFISKQLAQDWLMKSPNGTFLLRFSDSELGGITIAWVAEDPNKPSERNVWNLAPFTDKHFKIRGLGDTIKDLDNLVYLYPNINKSQCFSKFWTQLNGGLL
ncbi:hypothetical protein HELRODRAFT_156927 [Helobdella robusta]|uniref:Signal transducer and activator of transcription n=1 Tax=Helobdella robusta TaxID=6412 RepID=T1EM34_HELRO|nr:hypothetical protein HELRODRAFT_156927 [Helobdella robusta]ESO05053.1 hypothetical protein HELRODRAFT_156927 [Helobdella robusta]